MKNFFVLHALFFFALAQFPLAQAQNSGRIEGSVVDTVTGIGIAGVTVYFGSDQDAAYDTVTDASGRFEISAVRSGVYGSHFEKAGYVSQFSGTNGSVLKAVQVGRGNDTEPVRLRIEMVALASVRGRVLDPEGKPAAKATVTLGRVNETTDDEGQFVFAKLVPGSYTLQASLNSGTYNRQAAGEDRVEVVPTWFPSVIESSQAEHIRVRGGANLSGYDIRLRTASVYRVRGVVLAENGRPQLRAVVHNEPASEHSLGFDVVNMGGLANGRAVSLMGSPLGYFIATPGSTLFLGEGLAATKDGAFEFASVPRGQRKFTAAIETEEGVQLPVTATVSAVVDHDIDDLQIRFSAPFTVEGSVELAGATGSETPAVVKNVSVHLDGLNAPGQKKPDGSFRLMDVVAGEHWIIAPPGLPGGYYLASVSLGGRDVTGQAVNLQPGTPPIQIVYKSNAGTVSGTVVKPDGDAGDGAAVVLIPEASLDSLTPDFGRVCPSGPGGGFEIESVKPGSYYAFAVNHLEVAKFYDPETARKIAAGAARVQVTEGSAVSVSLKVIRLDE